MIVAEFCLHIDYNIRSEGKPMEAKEFQKWIAEYYQTRGWTDLDIFVRVGFLSN